VTRAALSELSKILGLTLMRMDKVPEAIVQNMAVEKTLKLSKELTEGYIDVPEEIATAVSGMANALFVRAVGKVEPARVTYGDVNPVKYTITVTSENPLTKEEMESFFGCLKAIGGPAPAAILESFDEMSGKGPVRGKPVFWVGVDDLAPHGTFTIDGAKPMPSNGMAAVGGASPGLFPPFFAWLRYIGHSQHVEYGTTDESGRSSATFQVRTKPAPPYERLWKDTGIAAHVFLNPFSNVIFTASNVATYYADSQYIPMNLTVVVLKTMTTPPPPPQPLPPESHLPGPKPRRLRPFPTHE
jgi:hypothetical protein